MKTDRQKNAVATGGQRERWETERQKIRSVLTYTFYVTSQRLDEVVLSRVLALIPMGSLISNITITTAIRQRDFTRMCIKICDTFNTVVLIGQLGIGLH